MHADALATMLMVMDPPDALRLANTSGLPALLIRRESHGGFRLERSVSWHED
jgi:thiamine biosynthesis lipoprotein ApbE